MAQSNTYSNYAYSRLHIWFGGGIGYKMCNVNGRMISTGNIFLVSFWHANYFFWISFKNTKLTLHRYSLLHSCFFHINVETDKIVNNYLKVIKILFSQIFTLFTIFSKSFLSYVYSTSVSRIWNLPLQQKRTFLCTLKINKNVSSRTVF